ncbi:MurR/RpiR family transcriptional regulator [Rhizorhapis suberifaciens]|uniref:DNA-binding MurR/RpiR family transcriptional regulator n=1 Tax=Rhizorhapis suberifaciens TaxID=13656 RepID=A0A840HZ37_9SPHN|nr:MurR/RpiR family transcriptional regulator [Rhizorhapis suberifaciens]MBB4642830.1 DNA-binding MurR/RpiR family transcriptional regulator [Rhizorhapis suberifaciens]
MDETVSTPSTAEELRVEIQERYETLSTRLKQFARYVLDEPHDVAFETLAVIAERSGVQPSAIVRFAQSFGFPGASQMQRLLRENLLASDSRVGYAERIRQFRNVTANQPVEGPGQLLNEFVEGNTLALHNLSHAVGQKDLMEAVEIIAQAKVVYVVAFRRAFPVASYLGYLLAQTNKQVVFVDGVAGMALQQARSIGPNDLLIAISYTPYAGETLEIVEMAAQKSVKILAISDSVISPIGKHASLVLQVRESDIRGFRSLSASMCLAQALAISYAVGQNGRGS